MPQIRPMRASDLPAIMDIQLQCYQPNLHEEHSVIRRRLALHPQHSWVIEDASGICAYLFSYPSQIGTITALDGDFAAPEQANCLYLHDLAVAQHANGRGLGPKLVRHALDCARQQALPHSALVAVQNSTPFWARQGFNQAPALTAEQRQSLASYPVSAQYLVQHLR